MRRFFVLTCVLLGCGQPTLVSCPDGLVPCADGCVDVREDAANCGACGVSCTGATTCMASACVPTSTNATCAVDNGGCSVDADCVEMAGSIACVCMPGFTGSGVTCSTCTTCGVDEFEAAPCAPFADAVCASCTACGVDEFEAAPCAPFADTVCAPCTSSCPFGTFEAAACSQTADRVCVNCTTCASNQYEEAACSGTQDTACGTCDVGCATCTGPFACTSCELGFVLEGDACVPEPMAMCGNAILESGEDCDDGDFDSGDGCSDMCFVETDYYCFGEAPSFCRPGSCVTEAATALPLGPDFMLDGTATASAAGLTFSAGSSVLTTSDVQYPILIEVDVVYSGDDITFVGARGDGLRDAMANDEPTDSLRARLTQSTGNVELATGPGVNVIASTLAPFTPEIGVPYRVRFVDDGLGASVEWFNLTNPAEGVALMELSSFHGSADRAFVGGASSTISNLRVCSAPQLPVTSGLVARYSATPSWTVVRDTSDLVSRWEDTSGNGNHLDVNGASPVYAPGVINSGLAALDFDGGARLTTSAFPLTTDVTVFAVIHYRTPATWGAIAHHGSRDFDWSMEQSGLSGDSHTLHWQTSNDNVAMDITLMPDTSYVLAGRFEGNARHFSATAFVGDSPPAADIVDASHSITAGSKQLFVGTSDASEASNAAIGEIVYFNRALSDGERDAVIDYLRTVWRAF